MSINTSFNWSKTNTDLENITVPTALSELSDDSTHRLVTDTEKTTWNDKVDKVTGKGLSTEDYTTAEKANLAAITEEINNAKSPESTLAAKISGLASIEIGAGVYNTGNLQKYYAALDKMEDTDAIHNVVMLGNSAAEGYYSGATPIDYLLNSFTGLLNAAYAQKYGDMGLGFIPVFAPYGSDVVWDFDVNWSSLAEYGVTGSNMHSTTSGAVATFTFTGTGVTVLCVAGSSTGAFTAKIDGVSKGSFDTYQLALDGAKDFVIAAAGTLTNAEHVLEITTSSTDIVLICGAYALTNTTNGIRVIRSCRYGITAGHVVENENVLEASIGHWIPILTIIPLISNDATAATNLVTYKANLQTLVTWGQADGDVILFANYPNPDYELVTFTDYIAAMHEVADTNNCLFIDLCTAYAGKLDALGYVSGDGIHPTAAFQRRMYKALAQVL
jgi:hypothetical protein